MSWALWTTKSFTEQRHVWKLEANELQKSKAKETNSNAAEALTDDHQFRSPTRPSLPLYKGNEGSGNEIRWRCKHSVPKIFTSGFWRSDKVLAFRRNKNSWRLLCWINYETLAEVEYLSQINKLQRGKCFLEYLCIRCFGIKKLVRKNRKRALSMKLSMYVLLWLNF